MLFENEKVREHWKGYIEDLYNSEDMWNVSGYLENELNVDDEKKCPPIIPKQNSMLL